jgi:predicted ferric reductase
MATNTRLEPAPATHGPGLGAWLAFGMVVLLGMAAGVVALWVYLPGLAASLAGVAPKAYWYLARSSAFAAYGLLWLSMVTGLLLSNRLARLWPGGPTAYDLHQYTSLLGLVLAVFHAAILLGDGYLNYTVGQLLVPFASTPYLPLWVGLGQVAVFALGLATLSFYVRRRLGPRAWRWVHALSFAAFLLALLHGVQSGTDTALPVVQWGYWATGGSVLFLSLYRGLLGAAEPMTRVARGGHGHERPNKTK